MPAASSVVAPRQVATQCLVAHVSEPDITGIDYIFTIMHRLYMELKSIKVHMVKKAQQHILTHRYLMRHHQQVKQRCHHLMKGCHMSSTRS